MQALKQPVTLESFNHGEALKMLLSDKLWLIIFVALLIFLKAFKVRVLNRKNEALTGDWKELNKETCM